MIQEKELSPEAQKAILLIEKLFRLAARNSNAEESANALAKANKLMEDFNLDKAAIEENSGDSAKRSDEKLKGGHYAFQRELWEDVAKLNFCVYMSITEVFPQYKMMPRPSGTGFKRTKVGETRQRFHRLVGRTVNVRATHAMTTYLEGAIERITAEHLGERFDAERLSRSELYSTYANSFREGMVRRICEKIYDRRQELMEEETRKAEEARKKANKEAVAGVQETGRAVALASFTQSEHDQNMELIQPGYIAAKAEAEARRRAWDEKEAARRAERARILAEQEAAYARWAERNPAEAKLQAELERKKAEKEAKREARNAARRTGRSYSYNDGFKGDRRALAAGYAAGANVSLDPQLSKKSRKGRTLG